MHFYCSSLRFQPTERFQKGLDAIKPLIILPHLTFNYCFYTCGANMPVASNQVSHATPPAFLLFCVSPAVLSQHPVFHGSSLPPLGALLLPSPLLPKIQPYISSSRLQGCVCHTRDSTRMQPLPMVGAGIGAGRVPGSQWAPAWDNWGGTHSASSPEPLKSDLAGN